MIKLNFVKPKPPYCIGEQIVDHLTRWNLNSSLKPPHGKSLCSFSIPFATSKGIGKKEKEKKKKKRGRR
jgi:hypothetical protein